MITSQRSRILQFHSCALRWTTSGFKFIHYQPPWLSQVAAKNDKHIIEKKSRHQNNRPENRKKHKKKSTRSKQESAKTDGAFLASFSFEFDTFYGRQKQMAVRLPMTLKTNLVATKASVLLVSVTIRSSLNFVQRHYVRAFIWKFVIREVEIHRQRRNFMNHFDTHGK